MKDNLSSDLLVIACVIGTRPEVIKMAPVIFALQRCTWAKVVLINTAQHRQLVDEMLEVFNLIPDIDFNLMTANQSLGMLTASLCKSFDDLLKTNTFNLILGVGDTTSVMVASLMAFYYHIPFGHIEAGLRSKCRYEPFPEEMNRVLTTVLADFNFAPTDVEKLNLLKENINEGQIYVTGNTVIDSLYWIIAQSSAEPFMPFLSKFILVTTHRRENIGNHMNDFCRAILKLSKRFTDVEFVIPIHPNPQVSDMINQQLGDNNQIYLIPPLKYTEFAQLMSRSLLIMTDSGGIQEEAPALRKPLIILRDVTERTEVITHELGLLAGTSTDSIVHCVEELLTNDELYKKMSRGISPYGDGAAAERIVGYIYERFMRQDQ